MIQLQQHHGYPVLREAEPIELAVIQVGSRSPDRIIYLHPRYVPSGFPHERVSARVYRRGRTLDLFLEEPLEIDGKEYGILNFKGVGAEADKPLMISPDLWWYDKAVHIIFRSCWDKKQPDNNRVWGAVTRGQADYEYFNVVLARYGIPHSPHLAVNHIPSEIAEQIRKVEEGEQYHDLAQIVRAQQTNLRIIDKPTGFEKRRKLYTTPEAFAEIDARVIKAQLELQKQGVVLKFDGEVVYNRFIDGTFTDLENYSLEDSNPNEAAEFPTSVVLSSVHMLSTHGQVKYLRQLEERTGLPFSSVQYFGSNSVKAPTIYEVIAKELRARQYSRIERQMKKIRRQNLQQRAS